MPDFSIVRSSVDLHALQYCPNQEIRHFFEDEYIWILLMTSPFLHGRRCQIEAMTVTSVIC